MKFFRRKKNREPSSSDVICPHCGSNATFPSVPFGGDASVSIKAWRGSRYIERRCRDCGRSFYVDIPAGDNDTGMLGDDEDIDDEALELAEEDLKRHTDAEGDHRFPF